MVIFIELKNKMFKIVNSIQKKKPRKQYAKSDKGI